jgi:undecaprenyl-diphosphatase
LDKSILLFINHGWANPVLDRFFGWVSLWYAFGVPIGLVMLLLFRRRWEKRGTLLWLFLVVLLLVGETGGRLIKHITMQPRPCFDLAGVVREPNHREPGPCDNARGGMPSNHALDYFAAATLVATTFRSRWWTLCGFGIAILVGISRVYLGQHYPSQVMAGASLGILWGLVGTRFARRRLHLPEDDRQADVLLSAGS